MFFNFKVTLKCSEISFPEEEYIWEAYFATLKSHLEIEKHKSKLQISLRALFI